MLDKQEKDRLNEIMSREKRAQDFMNQMADTVIKNMDERQKDEDNKIKRYELEKEMRERLDDERRIKKIKDDQKQMSNFLFQ